MSVPRAVIHEADIEDGPPAYYFVVKSANGEVVATSEFYTRREDAERGIYDLRNVIQSKTFRVEHE